MTPAVEFKGLSKSFNGVLANVDISFRVQPGSIHAVIGENGAGKSTAMKILYGTHQPDSGDVLIDGKVWGGRGRPWSSPADAIQCGIGMVHQHFMLGEPHTVLENILLGVEESRSYWKCLPKPFRRIDRKSARAKLEKISRQYGMAVDLDAQVESLSVGIQQRIEILKILYREVKILILDEPTAVLTPQETLDLFEHLRQLRSEGKTVIVITHKLKEVMHLADRVTVFRAGKVVGEREIGRTNEEDLASLMVGRMVNLRRKPPAPPKPGPTVMELKGVHLDGRRPLRDLNLKVSSGEIVGIAGVEGNGQSELIQLLLHARELSPGLRGSVSILGQNVAILETSKIKKLGVGVIPEDRHKEGLLLERPVWENFSLGLHRRAPFSRRGLVSKPDLYRNAEKAVKEFDIRPRSIRARAAELSGGNQQKVIIAREFNFPPQFLIAAQPTRGVDVGAIEFIHQRILDAREAGCGVLLVSSELDEILTLADRILVLYEGRIAGEFLRGEATEKTLGLKMGGAES